MTSPIQIPVPAPYVSFAESASELRSSSGTLTYLPSKQPIRSQAYSVVFPGYTGDALTHESFIKEALRLGLGVICVTPNWSNSTRRLHATAATLAREADGFTLPQEAPVFVRAVSFGCDLSIAWLTSLGTQASKIAWITPCSARHLVYAAKLMKLDLLHDDADLSFSTNAPVLLEILKGDAIVPETDSIFLSASPITDRITISGADHFDAGGLPDASTRVAKWFHEGLQ